MILSDIRQSVNKKINQYEIAIALLNKETERLNKYEQQIIDIKQAQEILQEAAQVIQQKAHEQIECVVTKCLESIFGDKYGFRIVFEKKRNKTEAKLLLLKDGNEIEDALNSDSGGVVDIAALALRIACIALSRPSLRRLLILDEPFRNVDQENKESLRILLEELSGDFNMQFIIVTHETAFQTGRVIKI